MLPRENRLKKKKDFERVFRKGKGVKGNFLVLKILEKKENKEEPRFGFIVSQKVSKKATLRNKIKRRLREAVRKNLKFLKKGIDGIFIALPGIKDKDFQKIKEEVEFLLKKTKVFKNEEK